MKAVWYKGYSGNKADRKKELLSYRNAFEEAKKILEEEFEESVPDYDNPSWSHKQADVNGANRMLQKVIDLLTIEG